MPGKRATPKHPRPPGPRIDTRSTGFPQPDGPEDAPIDPRPLGELVRSRRTELGLTLQVLADRAGASKSYLSAIENGTRAGAPGDALLGRLEAALELDPGTLLQAARWRETPGAVRRHLQSLEGAQRAASVRLRELLSRGTPALGELRRLVDRLDPEGARGAAAEALAAALPVEVPLVNSVQAGYPREFTDLGYPARVADDYVRTPGIRDPDAFAARVVGDSMTPDYREGDIVVFSPARPVAGGMDCFVRLEHGAETTFKRVYFEGPAGQELVRLQPLNPAFPPRVEKREDVAAIYAAVSVTRAL